MRREKKNYSNIRRPFSPQLINISDKVGNGRCLHREYISCYLIAECPSVWKKKQKTKNKKTKKKTVLPRGFHCQIFVIQSSSSIWFRRHSNDFFCYCRQLKTYLNYNPGFTSFSEREILYPEGIIFFKDAKSEITTCWPLSCYFRAKENTLTQRKHVRKHLIQTGTAH